MEVDAELFEVFECPAGSAIIFTEALLHSAHPWMDEQNDRMALFSCFDTVNAKWGKTL
jgi:hypothetical protein